MFIFSQFNFQTFARPGALKLAINRLLQTESKERKMCNFSRNFKKI